VKADPDVIAVIDSILAEAGDERAPMYNPPFQTHQMVQAWIDRLRGIRAALKDDKGKP
jgi:hypothetical protein